MGRVIGTHLHIISLGQGQGPIAESTLNMAIRSGDWVCLQVSRVAGRVGVALEADDAWMWVELQAGQFFELFGMIQVFSKLVF